MSESENQNNLQDLPNQPSHRQATPVDGPDDTAFEAAKDPDAFFQTIIDPHQIETSAQQNQAAQTESSATVSEYSFGSFQSSDTTMPTTLSAGPKRSISGFFDSDASTAHGATAGTESGQRGLANDYLQQDIMLGHKKPQVQAGQQRRPGSQAPYQGGLTAEQAFFFSDDPDLSGPTDPAPQLSTPSFDKFQQSSPSGSNSGQFRSGDAEAGTSQSFYNDGADEAGQEEQSDADSMSAKSEIHASDQGMTAGHGQSPLPASRARLITGKEKPQETRKRAESPLKTIGPEKHPGKPSANAALRQARRLSNADMAEDQLDELEESQLDTISRLQRMVTPEAKGTFLFSFYQAKDILTDPRKFFAKLPSRGTVAESAIFLLIYSITGGLLAGLINSNLLITFEFVLINTTAPVILSLMLSRILLFMGSTEGFEPTFRVVTYSQACLLIAGLKFPIFGHAALAFAVLYGLYLQVLGLQALHDLPVRKLTFAVIATTAFLAFIKFKLGILFF